MSNLIIAIAVFLITVIGALFAVPYFIDWNGYRGVFEEEATRLLGREVRVGGAVNLHLLPTPYFRLEKVRIADSSVNLQEPFFRADSLTIKLSVPPILRGLVEANEIELQRPVLRLALDGNDGWNWQTFGQVLGNSAYLPSNVALTSVRITDGVLAVHAPSGMERTRFDGLNGELSAPALDGPYRFRGTLGKARGEREVRIATARPEADGSVRFKATLRPVDGASLYTLDGRLLDLTGRPRIEGELTARLPVRELWQTPAQAGSRAARPPLDEERKPDRAEAAFDLKAAASIDPAGATLTDLALSFEQDGKPQLITGGLKALWRDGFAVEMSLASQWLDLDRIAGGSEKAAPLDSIVPLAIGLRDLLPAETRSRARFSVEQANIGGEPVSGLRLSLVRSADRLEIEEFRLAMPGGSRGELQGVVTGGPSEAPVLDGSVGVRGGSLVRFLGWASGNALALEPKGDGPFGVRAQISVAPGRAAAKNLVGDLNGTAIYASAQYRWEGRPEVTLALDSPQLDARAFIPAGSSLGNLAELVLHGPPPPAPGETETRTFGAPKAGWRSAQTDAVLRVNAGQLIAAARTYRDVALEIELKGGRLKMPLLRVAGDDGFSLEVEGDVDDAAARPKGSLRAAAAADTAPGVAALAELLGVPATFRPNVARAQAMVPLRMAGSIALGTRKPGSADLVLDGEANGAAVNILARLDGSANGWRAGPADVTAVIDGSDAAAIAALLAPGTSPARAGNPTPGRLLLKAVGVPSTGLASLASVEAGDVGLVFRGQLTAAEAGNKAAGELEIKAADGTRMAALAGLAPPLRLDGVPVAGTLRIAADGKILALDRLALSVGGNDVKGQITLTPAGDRRRVEARLDLEELTVARLLAPLLDQRLAIAGAAEAAVAGRQSPWPDEAFDASVLDGFEGTLRLTARRLALEDGVGLSQARLDIELAGGRIDVKRIEGSCLGGRCSADLRIDKVPAGVEVGGSLKLTGGRLEALAGGPKPKPAATGTLGAEIKFSGKGTSPRAVLSVLQGGGTLTLGDARLGTLWPGAVGVATEAALQAEPDNLAKVLRQAFGVALASGELALPGTIAVDIADGQLTAKPIAVDTAEGRAAATASLDLKTLAFESEWRLEPRLGGAGSPAHKPALPAVTVLYRGPVASLGAIEPRIGTEALERELSVRRMERDVEELERLRKLDETRRREEADRQRRQFEQSIPPPRLPPGPVPMAPAVPQPRPATPG